MHRVDRERRKNGINRLFKIVRVILPLVIAQIFIGKEEDILLLQSRDQSFVPKPILIVDHLSNALRNGEQLLFRTHPVGSSLAPLSFTLLPQASHSNLKKLI